MLPVIGAVMGGVGGAIQVGRWLGDTFSPSNSSSANKSASTFAENLTQQSALTKTVDPAVETQTLLNLQRAGKPLSLDQQKQLGQWLQGRTVQVNGADGKPVLGKVQSVAVQNQGVQVQINGRYFQIGAVQAVLDGIK